MPTTALDIRRGPGSTTTALDQRAMIAHLRRLSARIGPGVGDGVPGDGDFVVGDGFGATGTALHDKRQTSPTDVRAEIVGQSSGGARASHVGTWRLTWQRVDTGWQIVEWTAGPSVTSRAAGATLPGDHW